MSDRGEREDSHLNESWENLVPVGTREKVLLRRFLDRVASIIAQSIGSLLPTPEWYTATVQVIRLLAPVCRLLIGSTRFRNDPRRGMIESWLISTILQRIDAFEKPFPVPIKTTGTEELFEAWNHPHGVVICSVHLPLWNLILRSLVDLNCPPSAVVAGTKAIWAGMFHPWGSVLRLPALVANKNVYIKARGVLRHGGSVATMMDLGAPLNLNLNLLRLIGTLGARVIFATVELGDGGDVLVQFSSPPDPFCRTEESIRSNIEFFKSKIDYVLHPRGRTPAEVKEPPYARLESK